MDPHLARCGGRLADVVDGEVELPLVAGFAEAALPAAGDHVGIGRDGADEALIEARGGRGGPGLSGGSPDRPPWTVERGHEQPRDATRVEVVHRLWSV